MAEPTCTVPLDKIGKKAALAVTAVDKDELESERSAAVDVVPPQAAK